MIEQLECRSWNLHFYIRESYSSSWHIYNSCKQAVNYIGCGRRNKEVISCCISKIAIFDRKVSWWFNSEYLILPLNVQTCIWWINQSNLGLNWVNQVHLCVSIIKFDSGHFCSWIEEESKLAINFIYDDVSGCESWFESHLEKCFVFVCAVNASNICIWNIKLSWQKVENNVSWHNFQIIHLKIRYCNFRFKRSEERRLVINFWLISEYQFTFNHCNNRHFRHSNWFYIKFHIVWHRLCVSMINVG